MHTRAKLSVDQMFSIIAQTFLQPKRKRDAKKREEEENYKRENLRQNFAYLACDIRFAINSLGLFGTKR